MGLTEDRAKTQYGGKMSIREEVTDLRDELVALRRDFHMHPELGFQEFRTSKIVGDYLESLGVEVKRGVGKTGVVGLLKGKREGKTVMLRADMDAIPIQELNDVQYRSQSDGVMHACGHDGHISMLLAAAKILVKHKGEIEGNIKFVFQPCEETMPGGAKAMVDDGILANPHVDATFGIHLISSIPTGTIGIREGAMMAAGDKFIVNIMGKGGHGASPHSTVDPIVTSSYVIQGLQTIVSRETNPMEAVVLTVGKIEGGTAFNVIPDAVKFDGTVRTLNESLHEEIPGKMERIIKGVCEAFRAQYKLDYQAGVPVVVNDSNKVKFVKSVAEEVVGKGHVVDYHTMGYDDVSYFLQAAPGAFYFIGSSNKDKGTDCPHHNPHFDIDEDSLLIGTEMHVRVASGFLMS